MHTHHTMDNKSLETHRNEVEKSAIDDDDDSIDDDDHSTLEDDLGEESSEPSSGDKTLYKRSSRNFASHSSALTEMLHPNRPSLAASPEADRCDGQTMKVTDLQLVQDISCSEARPIFPTTPHRSAHKSILSPKTCHHDMLKDEFKDLLPNMLGERQGNRPAMMIARTRQNKTQNSTNLEQYPEKLNIGPDLYGSWSHVSRPWPTIIPGLGEVPEGMRSVAS
jgi:hypothetical protein